ncbi:hypothetical protein DFJ73DRAFT_817630 [Zopfochytrium polystomum]|nr:hypothetical protein DFJ73DRAFT_817630 [Zopfochytrium polystomum]
MAPVSANGAVSAEAAASTLTLDFLLPPPPAGWDRDKTSKIHKRIHPLKKGTVEPIGSEFLTVLRRHRYNRTLSQDWELEAALRDAKDGDDDAFEDEPETEDLLASNPDNWKEQDHYRILGISKLRWKATEDDIKRAYRRKVLKHHPDKKAGASGNTNDDNYFKCLQKAWEVISDPVKRRQWDSVDPEFDETLPGPKFKGDFFQVFGAAFESEARFCKRPASLSPFGDINSTREEVEKFYEGWFNFESWRTFEMLDEDEEGLGDSREEKRYLDKKNKAARAKRKKEDNARIFKFVETAHKLDPRMARFKEEEKQAKEAKKREKEQLAKAAILEAERKAEEERKQKEQAELEERERRDQERKEKEATKRLVRKAKKEIKAIYSSNNGFLPTSASVSEIEANQSKFDAVLDGSELWHLEEFKFRLEEAQPKGLDALKACFEEEYESSRSRQEATSRAPSALGSTGPSTPTLKKAKIPWTTKEVTTLIKAVKSFPGGTNNRWEKIAEYINLHGREEGGPAPERGPEECIKKSRELQDATLAERNAMQAAVATKKKEVEIKETPTSRAAAEAVAAAIANKPGQGGSKSTPKETKPSPSPSPAPSGFVIPEGDSSWSASQQAALEAALRKFPASQFTAAPAERWEKIAGEIEGKSKKEVKQRVKDLADAIKKKNKK